MMVICAQQINQNTFKIILPPIWTKRRAPSSSSSSTGVSDNIQFRDDDERASNINVTMRAEFAMTKSYWSTSTLGAQRTTAVICILCQSNWILYNHLLNCLLLVLGCLVVIICSPSSVFISNRITIIIRYYIIIKGNRKWNKVNMRKCNGFYYF